MFVATEGMHAGNKLRAHNLLCSSLSQEEKGGVKREGN